MDRKVNLTLEVGNQLSLSAYKIVVDDSSSLHDHILSLEDLLFQRVGVVEVVNFWVQDVFVEHRFVEALELFDEIVLLELLFFNNLLQVFVQTSYVVSVREDFLPFYVLSVDVDRSIEGELRVIGGDVSQEAVLEVVQDV